MERVEGFILELWRKQNMREMYKARLAELEAVVEFTVTASEARYYEAQIKFAKRRIDELHTEINTLSLKAEGAK